MNILITNIGRRGYLVEFIKNTINFNGKVYASDCDKTASGLYGNVDKSFILPKPVDDEQSYVENLLKLCLEYDINLIIPVIDPEIYILSKYKNVFSEKGIIVLVSDKRVLEICYDKTKMNTFLTENGFNIIKTYDNLQDFKNDLFDNKIEFPVFIKPIYGSGSVDSRIIDNDEELVTFYKPGMIIQEYLNGEEYGIDTFVDNDGIPVRVVVKKKLSMRSGETDKAITVKHEDIKNVIKKLAEKLKPFGPFDTDVIETNNGIYVIDINPRFGGGYPATHMAEVSFIELLLKSARNESIEPAFDNYVIGQLTMKDVGIKTVNIEDKRYKEL
ncbi:ATP-grasp domain-containing protein [Clostridium sp. D2Q-14]|uniref:ATP-grasp domain-containing protein n=1 Tax=Anaeromonas gelatinilytica TaxID=2683194 RepID=UPI00193C3C5A|nr:ATP-grasp domain-containing protein [Anaeromonas gelatinilytica]MBS4534376.1 ATP-grasp domain-containing protein [Anaeromonas gelatinilytica]